VTDPQGVGVPWVRGPCPTWIVLKLKRSLIFAIYNKSHLVLAWPPQTKTCGQQNKKDHQIYFQLLRNIFWWEAKKIAIFVCLCKFLPLPLQTAWLDPPLVIVDFRTWHGARVRLGGLWLQIRIKVRDRSGSRYNWEN